MIGEAGKLIGYPKHIRDALRAMTEPVEMGINKLGLLAITLGSCLGGAKLLEITNRPLMDTIVHDAMIGLIGIGALVITLGIIAVRHSLNNTRFK